LEQLVSEWTSVESKSIPTSDLLCQEMAFRVERGRGGQGRGRRPISNAEVMEEVRIMQERMEAMEVARHRDPEVGDISESKRNLLKKEREQQRKLYK
jgi:hypothetical protein